MVNNKILLLIVALGGFTFDSSIMSADRRDKDKFASFTMRTRRQRKRELTSVEKISAEKEKISAINRAIARVNARCDEIDARKAADRAASAPPVSRERVASPVTAAPPVSTMSPVTVGVPSPTRMVEVRFSSTPKPNSISLLAQGSFVRLFPNSALSEGQLAFIRALVSKGLN